ncbi:hypothetical protein [Actinoplanes sp. NPDC026623]|uniref:hypothetical protein n=1 Tax=Actinoplanes sp. NPDC026623 TaxID=3155610 RepID=UPI0033DEDA7F
MNENDLREAMRSTLVATPEPPPMDSATALTAGRRAARRRMTLAGAGAATVLATLGIAAAGPGLNLLPGDHTTPWAAPASEPAIPLPTDTKPSWPIDGDGRPQQDATARSGLRYEQGKRVLNGILAVVPDGYVTPTGNAGDGIPLQDHQAAVEGDGSWGYLASAAVAKDKGTGRLLVEVHTKDNKLAKEPCALAREFWGLGGTCERTTVAKATVGVVVTPGTDRRLDQWAAYRYPDGTVVFVAQSRSATNFESGLKPLDELPLTVPQLAALATDDRFHLQ